MPKIALLLTTLALFAPTIVAAAEELVLEPYPARPAWKEVTTKRQGVRFLRELIPADQKIETYRDILTAQGFPLEPGATPAGVVKGIFAGTSGACEGVRVNGPKETTENGFRVAYAQVYCGRQKGKGFGVVMFFKVIQGKRAMYVVQREFRVPPQVSGGVQSFSKDELPAMTARLEAQSAANKYLVGSVYVCGDGSTAPKCSGR